VNHFYLLENETLSQDWFQKKMQLDPLKTFSFIAYFLLVAISIQIIAYSKWEKNEKWKIQILQVSISSTLYSRKFRTNIALAAFTTYM